MKDETISKRRKAERANKVVEPPAPVDREAQCRSARPSVFATMDPASVLHDDMTDPERHTTHAIRSGSTSHGFVRYPTNHLARSRSRNVMRGHVLSVGVFLLAVVLTGCAGSGPGNTTEEDAPSATGGFSDTHVFPGNYSMEGGFSHPLQDGPYEVLDPEVVDLVSDADGAQIEIGFFRPDLPAGRGVP